MARAVQEVEGAVAEVVVGGEVADLDDLGGGGGVGDFYEVAVSVG